MYIARKDWHMRNSATVPAQNSGKPGVFARKCGPHTISTVSSNGHALPKPRKNPRTTHPTVKVKLTKARKEALTAPQVYIRTEEVVGFDWQDIRIVLLQRTNHIT